MPAACSAGRRSLVAAPASGESRRRPALPGAPAILGQGALPQGNCPGSTGSRRCVHANPSISRRSPQLLCAYLHWHTHPVYCGVMRLSLLALAGGRVGEAVPHCRSASPCSCDQGPAPHTQHGKGTEGLAAARCASRPPPPPPARVPSLRRIPSSCPAPACSPGLRCGAATRSGGGCGCAPGAAVRRAGLNDGLAGATGVWLHRCIAHVSHGCLLPSVRRALGQHTGTGPCLGYELRCQPGLALPAPFAASTAGSPT